MKTQGEIEAWEKSGIVTSKIWYTALDERVDPDCAALHGEEIPVKGVFLGVGGATATGKVNDYEPVIGAPLHPRCRCTLLPVTSSKSVTKELTLQDKMDLYISTLDEGHQIHKETA